MAAFHRRPLKDVYKALMLDGVVLARKTGAGALKRPVLVALGIRHDGKKEIIDFRLAASESAAEWERFLTDLWRRGLIGDGLEVICADGGQGLIAARRRSTPPSRSSAAGRTRSETSSTRCVRPTVTPQGRPPRHRECSQPAQGAQRRPTLRRDWEKTYPKAAACLRNDLDDLLTCFRYATLAERKQVRTTNAIERRPRGPAKNPAHGNLPGDLHVPYPLRRLRRQNKSSMEPPHSP